MAKEWLGSWRRWSRTSAARQISARTPKRVRSSVPHFSRRWGGQMTRRLRAPERARSSVQIRPAPMVLRRLTSSAMKRLLLGDSRSLRTGLN